jgi:hypothetical protein
MDSQNKCVYLLLGFIFKSYDYVLIPVSCNFGLWNHVLVILSMFPL